MKLNDSHFNYFIGKKIREARQMKGVKQEDLAKALGFSRIALSTYESGRSRLTVYQLMLISEILDLPFNFFLPENTKKTEMTKKQRENYETNTEEDIYFALEMSLRSLFLLKGISKNELVAKVQKAISLIDKLLEESSD